MESETKSMTRSQLGYLIITLDFLIMGVLLVSIKICEYLIQCYIDRYKKSSVECSNFAISIENLPYLDENYTLQHLKADLWEYIDSTMQEHHSIEPNNQEQLEGGSLDLDIKIKDKTKHD